MRTCPFTGCGQQISPDKFACFMHWNMHQRDERARIWEAFELYQAGKITIDKLREIQEAVVKSVESRGPQKQSECSSCHAVIRWAITENNKRIPLNYPPNERGNIVLRDGVAVFLKKSEMEQPDLLRAEERYTSHFYTCPQAAKFRRNK